ncbi:MAG: phosphonate ABC transporter, permease protein PhnE [Deltaproteobacteria bacterium]|jgi:phosphonate transport system permease protein|nr:phosphonate ABC transporter, permease protein PhnE [Deltaproteobacteria bacterium]
MTGNKNDGAADRDAFNRPAEAAAPASPAAAFDAGVRGRPDAPAAPSPPARPGSGLDALAAKKARPTPGRILFFVALAFLLAWSWRGAEIRPGDLWRDAGNMLVLARDFMPPDFTDIRLYLSEMVVTLHIALWGTILAVFCSVPLGIMCSENISPAWLRHPVRRVMDASRAINEMVFAMLFVVCVGLGAFAGVLALWVHTTGVLAKLFSEAAEAVDPQPVEGIRSTGAGLVAEVWFGVLPQVFPLWISFTLYRFESNVRSATVVGMVGAGGVGVVLWELVRGFLFRQTFAVMLVIIVAVTLFDLLSQKLRKMVS